MPGPARHVTVEEVPGGRLMITVERRQRRVFTLSPAEAAELHAELGHYLAGGLAGGLTGRCPRCGVPFMWTTPEGLARCAEAGPGDAQAAP